MPQSFNYREFANADDLAILGAEPLQSVQSKPATQSESAANPSSEQSDSVPTEPKKPENKVVAVHNTPESKPVVQDVQKQVQTVTLSDATPVTPDVKVRVAQNANVAVSKSGGNAAATQSFVGDVSDRYGDADIVSDMEQSFDADYLEDVKDIPPSDVQPVDQKQSVVVKVVHNNQDAIVETNSYKNDDSDVVDDDDDDDEYYDDDTDEDDDYDDDDEDDASSRRPGANKKAAVQVKFSVPIEMRDIVLDLFPKYYKHKKGAKKRKVQVPKAFRAFIYISLGYPDDFPLDNDERELVDAYKGDTYTVRNFKHDFDKTFGSCYNAVMDLLKDIHIASQCNLRGSSFLIADRCHIGNVSGADDRGYIDFGQDIVSGIERSLVQYQVGKNQRK